MVLAEGDAVGQGVLIPTIYPTIEETSPDEIHNETSARGNDGGILRELKGENNG